MNFFVNQKRVYKSNFQELNKYFFPPFLWIMFESQVLSQLVMGIDRLWALIIIIYCFRNWFCCGFCSKFCCLIEIRILVSIWYYSYNLFIQPVSNKAIIIWIKSFYLLIFKRFRFCIFHFSRLMFCIFLYSTSVKNIGIGKFFYHLDWRIVIICKNMVSCSSKIFNEFLYYIRSNWLTFPQSLFSLSCIKMKTNHVVCLAVC